MNEEESKIAKDWVKWCSSHPLAKATEFQVPDGILPYKYHGILIDVKVQGKGKYRGPDNKIYADHEDLRDNVARGNCVLELTCPVEGGEEAGDAAGNKTRNGNKKQIKHLFLVFALRKFSGGFGDEDDSQEVSMWHRFFIKPVEATEKIICTTKANGEAAHVSCCFIAGKYYFCLGSKNVHLLARDAEDLEKYKDSRFAFARVVGQAFFSHSFRLMGEEKIQELKEFLVRTRYTMVFELLQPQNQHIVNLSHLEEPQLQFICWADPYTKEKYSSLCGLSPKEGIDIARSFNLLTVDYEVIPAEEAESEMAKIRSETGYEGKVLYYLDASNNVLGLIKKKTCWYIILRAIREQSARLVSPRSPTSATDVSKGVQRRLNDIQKWIGFSDAYRDSWKVLGKAFVKWMADKKLWSDMRAQFPILWEQFLESSEKHKNIYDNLQYS